MYYFRILILGWNIIVFALYGIDKFKAVHHKYRISEVTLIIPSFVFAGVGAVLGMVVFNHKTSKIKFRILIPLALILNFLCFELIKGRLL